MKLKTSKQKKYLLPKIPSFQKQKRKVAGKHCSIYKANKTLSSHDEIMSNPRILLKSKLAVSEDILKADLHGY